MSTRKDRKAATLLESGLRQFKQGQLEQAQQSCTRALELVPRQPDAMHLLGVIALQQGDHARAVEILQRAVALVPDNPGYRANLAHGYLGLQRLPQALAAFERAARHEPDDPEFQLGVGVCLGLMGNAAESERVLRRLVERHPRFADGWFNLAKALEEQGSLEEACELYLRTSQLAPKFAPAHYNLGVMLNRLERYEEAEQAFRRCLACDPAVATARVGLAISLNFLRRHEEAEAQCREALSRSPQERGARAMLAKSLSGQGRWNDALRWFEDAIQEEPQNAELLSYLGDALARNGRVPEALDAFDRSALYGAGTSAEQTVPFGRAIALFSIGKIREGAAAWFGRDKHRAFSARFPGRALSDKLPHDLRDADVCVIGEQGLGDELFFLRYAPLLKARGCRVNYHGGAKITGILARCAVLDRALSDVAPLTAADVTLLVGDLPHLLYENRNIACYGGRGVVPDTNPAGVAIASDSASSARESWPEFPPPLLLKPVPERVATVSERLRQLGPSPCIGLTWRAGTDIQVQRGRLWHLFKEASFGPLAAALRGVGGTLISLQRNPRAGETERLAAILGRPVHDLSQVNEDLEAMLALLAVLDEYIGVSNTNMHLRASAGRTARVLVPWPAEWRWMISGDESPWFPGFRIYRQRPDGDWSAAFDQLTRDLQTELAKRLDT